MISYVFVVTDVKEMHNWKQGECAAHLKMNVFVHNYTEQDRGRKTQTKAGKELPGLCRRLKPISFATVGKKEEGKKKAPSAMW